MVCIFCPAVASKFSPGSAKKLIEPGDDGPGGRLLLENFAILSFKESPNPPENIFAPVRLMEGVVRDEGELNKAKGVDGWRLGEL